MTDDDLKKIQKSIKEELRPVKEVVEILQNKMGAFDLYQRSTSSIVKNIKDQQSVVNKKLDGLKTDWEEKMDQRITASEQKIIREISSFII